MPSFKKRSYQKELLDREDIPFADIRQNMKELDFINRHLGGHNITVDGLVALVPKEAIFNRPLHIVEIGCGGGDNLRAIREWAARMKLPVKLTGIDLNGECIAYALQHQKNRGLHFVQSDYRLAQLNGTADIIFSSLFCHHFTDDELVKQLQWMKANSAIGFFINDLHRHPAAYYSIRFLTSVFSRSYLVRNDAPLSVCRGFTGADWKRLFSRAGIVTYQLNWRWAFRWLVTCRSKEV